MIHDDNDDDNIYCRTCLIFMLMLMLDLLLQAETPGVTHFGAYHRPPDGHLLSALELFTKEKGSKKFVLLANLIISIFSLGHLEVKLDGSHFYSFDDRND